MDQREVSWATSCQKRDIPGLLDAGKEFRAILDQEDAVVSGYRCKFLDVAIREAALTMAMLDEQEISLSLLHREEEKSTLQLRIIPQ
jgi:hypothetical protein